MYEEFLDRYCKKHEIDKEEALTHAIVTEFLNEKEKLEREEEKNTPRTND